jgi:fructose transport system substrate-binding protein
MKSATVSPRRVRVVALASAAGVALALGACSSSSTSGSGGGSGSTVGSGEKIGVALITKDSTNPFFVAMQKGAKDLAAKQGKIDLTVSSGKQEGDDQGQITAIENAIAKGDKGILITPMSTGVNSAIKKARDAGLFVIALDTPPDPASTVDITFATDNFKAGQLIGTWAEVQQAGKPATIALLDLFNDKIVSVDYNRDQGFLTGMGIDTKDKKKNGDEDKTGKYKDGTYTIVCNEAGNGAEDGGRSAMERCLTKNPDINVVYTINEPTAVGASAALKAQGKTATIVSIDGGCAGVNSV